MSKGRQRQRLEIVGIVQGVGFRPFVYGLARRHGLAGFVRNHSRGVTIEIEGAPDAIRRFSQALVEQPPPTAVIESVAEFPVPPRGDTSFAIVESRSVIQQSTPVSPDLATCDECLREFSDPADRRYRYPFINCTHCGPRYTIVRDIPYDRPLTTMSSFSMCTECRREYDDPSDRRFHAQPNACPRCGPQLWWLPADAPHQHFANRPDEAVAGEAALAAFSAAIERGAVVAVKGLGGFHLACSAGNTEALARLRSRKGRNEKPFAVMAADVETVARFAELGPHERDLLVSPARPIVLLRKKHEPCLSPQVAPGNDYLGFMLPYSPLHTLLVQDGPLVMTSANLSEEPIVRTNNEAAERLRTLVDGFLLHDRDIHAACDDSVVRVFRGRALPVRRSRGYAPMPVRLTTTGPSVLAVGGELKATFCITKDGFAYVSPHIGDMGNLETLEAMERTVAHFTKLFRCSPELVVCDMHPGYLSRQWARRWASERNIPVVDVQHHHAHIAGVLLEHHWKSGEPVIGISFDGTGYGTDSAIWGGEILIASQGDFERWGHLKYVRLPGGDAAIRHPYRAALAHLWSAGIEWDDRLPPVHACPPRERDLLARQLQTGTHCVPTSSMGRLFDAIASLLGIRHSVSFEAQAAMELEARAAKAAHNASISLYPYAFHGEQPVVIDPAPLLEAIGADVLAGRDMAEIGDRFHRTIGAIIADACDRVRRQTGLTTVALSGGVFQNVRLLEQTSIQLEGRGFSVLIPQRFPVNDGGLALGQVAVALARLDVRQ